jgi:glycerol-3-phosphate acyltransferase PlsY
VLVLWIVTVRITGYVSVGSILAAAVFPVAVYLLHPARRPTIWVDGLLAALVIFLHRANIRRLLQGTEHRFGVRAKQAETSG